MRDVPTYRPGPVGCRSPAQTLELHVHDRSLGIAVALVVNEELFDDAGESLVAGSADDLRTWRQP